MLMCLATGCGRIGFDSAAASGADAAPRGDAAGGDAGIAPASLTDTATCESPAVLELRDGAVAGDTLLVVFFMREPDVTSTPTISGAVAAWETDVAIATVEFTNRRTIAVFRGNAAAAIAPGTTLTIDHPVARSNGAVLFRIGNALVPAEAPVTGEGAGPGFSTTHATAAQTALCVLVHHNGAGAVFDPPWQQRYELTANCGGARDTAGLHLATSPGGAVDCRGMLSDNISWASAIRGYDNLAL